MKITRTSIISGNVSTMELDVTQEQLDLYATRTAFVQDVFPNLTAMQREFIKTGITQAEWDKAFPEKDEEPEWADSESEYWQESDAGE